MQHPTVELTQDLLKTVIGNLANAVILVDREMRIVQANPMAEKWVGRNGKDLVGRAAGEMFGCIHAHQPAKGCGFAQPCGHCPVRQTVEKTFQSRRGEVIVDVPMDIAGLGARILKIGAQYLSLEQREGVLLSAEDVTEARTQAQLRAEKNRLETVLRATAEVCHELNQPLMVMSGYAELLLETRSGADDDGLLHHLQAQVARTAAISKKLMGLSVHRRKPSAGEGQVLDPHLSAKVPAAS